MTPADLRKLIENATPGPWEALPWDGTIGRSHLRAGRPTTMTASFQSRYGQADAALTVAAHHILPELLALWEAAEGLNSTEATPEDAAFLFHALDALNAKAEGIK